MEQLDWKYYRIMKIQNFWNIMSKAQRGLHRVTVPSNNEAFLTQSPVIWCEESKAKKNHRQSSVYSLFQCLTVNLNTNQRTVDLNTNQQVKSLIPLLACMGCIEPSPKAFFISLLSAQTPDSSGPERVGTRPSCIGYLSPTFNHPQGLHFLEAKMQTANAKKKIILITIFNLIVFTIGDVRLKT